jgi:hypothetical protein
VLDQSPFTHAKRRSSKSARSLTRPRCICPLHTLRYVPNSWVRTGTAASSMAVRVGARSEELFRSAVYSVTLRWCTSLGDRRRSQVNTCRVNVGQPATRAVRSSSRSARCWRTAGCWRPACPRAERAGRRFIPTFTRPPSLDPDPLYSWQNPTSFLADRFRCLRRGTLSGRFRRLLAEAAIAHRLLLVEHQVASASLPVRWADNHRRGSAPLRKPP